MMKLVYLFTLICIVTANQLMTALKSVAQVDVGCNQPGVACSFPTCPDLGVSDFKNRFQAMSSSKQCSCPNELHQCLRSRCTAAEFNSACTTLVSLLQSGVTCNYNCNANTVPSPSADDSATKWAILANNIGQAVASCQSNNNCAGMIEDCPAGANFGGQFAAMADSKKCACLNELLQCAYTRCPSADVKRACVDVVNGLKNYGFSSTCSSINCNAGFAGAIPSFAIIGSCLMLLLGIIWGH